MVGSRIAIVVGIFAIPGASATDYTSDMPGVSSLCYDLVKGFLPANPCAPGLDFTHCQNGWLAVQRNRLLKDIPLFKKCTDLVPGGYPFYCQIVHEEETTCATATDKEVCKVKQMSAMYAAKTQTEKDNFERCKAALGTAALGQLPGGACYVQLIKSSDLTNVQPSLTGTARTCDLNDAACKDMVFGQWLAHPMLGNDHSEKAANFAACRAVYNEKALPMCSDMVASLISDADKAGGDSMELLAAKAYRGADAELKAKLAECQKWNPSGARDWCYENTVMNKAEHDELKAKCAEGGATCSCCVREVLHALFVTEHVQDAKLDQDYKVCNSFFTPTSDNNAPETVCLRWEVRAAMAAADYTNNVVTPCNNANADEEWYCRGTKLQAHFAAMPEAKRAEILDKCLH